MHGIRGSFKTACLALTLALVLPAVVFMFGAIRNRQLQSKANPRWAQFAKVTGPSGGTVQTASVTRTVSEEIAEHQPDGDHKFELKIPTLGSLDLTGSVSGRSSVEMPVRTRVASASPDVPSESAESKSYDDQTAATPQQTIIFRPVDDADDSAASDTTHRLEQQLAQVRRRLDQLARQQASYHQDGQQQRSVLMEREAEFLDTLKKLSERANPQTVVVEVHPSEAPIAKAPTASAEVPKTSSNGEPVLAPDETAQVPEAVVAQTPARREVPPPPKEIEQPAISSHGEPRLDEPQSESPPAALPQASAPMEIADAGKEPAASGSASISNIPADEDDPIQIRRVESSDSFDRYTMEVRDANLRHFLSRLGEVSRVSIVPSSSVEGTISLSLYEVSFESALKAVLKSQNLVYEREDEIVLISTTDEVLRIKRQNRKLAMRIYQPNYLSTSELIRFIEPLLSEDGRHSIAPPSRPALGDGESSPDESPSHRDAVIVQDQSDVLAKIDQVMVDMDVPPLQVNIEAKIVCVRLSEGCRHGVDLSSLPCRRDDMVSAAEGGLKTAGLACDVSTFLKSIERLADTNVVTTQQIQVLNKQRAEMIVGDRVGIHSKTGEALGVVGGGTRLIFRPSISADGAVRLEIHPERSTVSMPKRANMPNQNITELTTQVLVHDGGTAVIGGLIAEQVVSKSGRTSVVANPFRQRGELIQRTELLILVTPHIVTDAGCDPTIPTQEQPSQGASGRQSRATRNNLAYAHYERASSFYQQGNLIRARQQVEASLRQNKADRDAIRLRNQIVQCLHETQSK